MRSGEGPIRGFRGGGRSSISSGLLCGGFGRAERSGAMGSGAVTRAGDREEGRGRSKGRDYATLEVHLNSEIHQLGLMFTDRHRLENRDFYS